MAGQNKDRKVSQEETGKRKGKLQINKDRKGKKAAVPEDFATRVTQNKVALYKTVVETDYGHLSIKEEIFPYYPGGAAAAMAMSNTFREAVRMFKEHAARRIREYEATGSLACYLPDGKLLPGFRQA